MTVIRTADELARAKWAEKYQSVADGKQYTPDGVDSPFPIHEYFRNKLLGKNVNMLEINAGTALIEQMVADTVTDMKIQIGDDAEDTDEEEIGKWLEEIDYPSVLEESMRDHFGVGYGVQQPVRTPEGDVRIVTIDPATFYPSIPWLAYEDISEARIVSVFDNGKDGIQDWYAFVETHEVGKLTYKLYKLENGDSLEGTEKSLSSLKQFADLQKEVETGLDFLALFVGNRQKSSRYLLGRSVLQPIWGILQEVSQIQTHMRQEFIKHGRAKMYGTSDIFTKANMVNNDLAKSSQLNSKELAQVNATQGRFMDLTQDLFLLPPGATMPPGYIQRDLQIIEKGSAEIDKLLSRAASIIGCPRSVFNLDDKGDIHVDTEKRKDRRYVRQIEQAQRRATTLTKEAIRTWWLWTKGGEPPAITVTLSSPFDLSQKERVELMREMNPSANFVSQKEGLKEIWPDKTPDELDELEQQIEEEAQLKEPPPNSALNNIPAVEL